ncbi:MAG: hypothetical protein J7K66_00505 [Anaerolineaceae bacterium]|nr:hypothetical protein [Anaerolineaceae bacterium]
MQRTITMTVKELERSKAIHMASEKLAERGSIQVSKETICQILMKEGLPSSL